MRVIVVEPWLGGSHRAWAEGFAAHSRHDVAVVGLAPRLWRWRLRGAAPELAAAIGEEIRRGGQPDALVVSSLVDLSSLLGLLRGVLSSHVPVSLYMHESQLLYPTSTGEADADAALRNWHSWLGADRIFFNSAFHRSALLAALPGFAQRLPEPAPSSMLDRVVERSSVLPVGIEPISQESRLGGPPIVLWSHRWEADKDPQTFVRAMRKLAREGFEFRLVLAGADGEQASSDRTLLQGELGDRVLASGPFDRATYRSWVARSDVVVSCAVHEFFGIGVAEALTAGCVPVLPRRLSYPELVGPTFESLLYAEGGFGAALRTVLGNLDDARSQSEGLAEHVRRFDWKRLIERYDTAFV